MKYDDVQIGDELIVQGGPDKGRRGTVLEKTKKAMGANSVSMLIIDGIAGGKKGTYVASNLEPL